MQNDSYCMSYVIKAENYFRGVFKESFASWRCSFWYFSDHRKFRFFKPITAETNLCRAKKVIQAVNHLRQDVLGIAACTKLLSNKPKAPL
jgi:hypothetical protein